MYPLAGFADSTFHKLALWVGVILTFIFILTNLFVHFSHFLKNFVIWIGDLD